MKTEPYKVPPSDEGTTPRRGSRLELTGLLGLPDIRQGDDLAELLGEGLVRHGLEPVDGDVLVVAQKIVSKSEGRLVALADVSPSQRAQDLALAVDKDPRLVELILQESREVVRHRQGVLVVEHRLGIVLANAGIDQSNILGDEVALLLPVDPDRSARELHERLSRRFGCALGVIINDSLGRAWRVGTVSVAIGAAGIQSVRDLRGDTDLYGRELRVSIVGHADELSSAASVVMGQGSEGIPAVLIQGLPYRPQEDQQPASAIVRSKTEDLFR